MNVRIVVSKLRGSMFINQFSSEAQKALRKRAAEELLIEAPAEIAWLLTGSRSGNLKLSLACTCYFKHEISFYSLLLSTRAILSKLFVATN